MQHLVDDVRGALSAKAWHAALVLALALPDICGYLETPTEKSSKRYPRWYKQNLEPAFTYDSRKDNPFHIPGFTAHTTEVLLSGKDCYALRCAFLHLGDFNITGQRARDILSRFVFIEPRGGSVIHMLQYPGPMLQLQVGIFCEAFCAAVENWMATTAGKSPDIVARIRALPKILIGPHITIFEQP